MQARKNAEAIELSMRLDRLQQQAGSSMVTTNTLASMDEEDDSALKRFNIILKACHLHGMLTAFLLARWRTTPRM